jgi:4a-hydroxytetrahydrobiopterin dehydratase
MSLAELAARSCRPIPAGTPRLPPAETRALLAELGSGWHVIGDRLRKRFTFADFAGAVAFVNRVGTIADAEDHHPDVALGWGRADVELWTHTVGGLSESDFIVAAKIEQAASSN